MLTTAQNEAMASGTVQLTTGVKVLNAENQDVFNPTFKAWFTKNPDNYGALENGTSTKNESNKVTAKAIKVSCAPLLNLILEESTEYVNYLSWYDFTAGDEVKDANLLAYLEAAGSLEENFGKEDPSGYTNTGNDENVAVAYSKLTENQIKNLANIRYGRMNALGITASLASEATNTNKGYKGCSLPVGTITFDLNLGVTTKIISGTVNSDAYYAVLWDYRPNAKSSGLVSYPEGSTKVRGWTDPMSQGTMERNMMWRGVEFSQYGMRTSPNAYRGSDTTAPIDTVYDSGIWSLTGIDGSEATTSSANSRNSVYTFTVKDYDFDLSSYLFPDRNRAENESKGKLGTTDFAFFGGYAQVLYVQPYIGSGTVNVYRQITVGNLEAETLGENTQNLGLNADKGQVRGQKVGYSNEVNTGDNKKTSMITQYSVGTFTKRNSFNTSDAVNHTNKAEWSEKDGWKSFLGTDFWDSPSWDESTYAGDQISIVGSAQLSTEADETIRAVNLLQLFDSVALSVTPTNNKTGDSIKQTDVDFGNFYENTTEGLHKPEVTWLFAADPAYKNGYDTNAEGTVSYMNTVREEDLIYSDTLYWNEEEGCCDQAFL